MASIHVPLQTALSAGLLMKLAERCDQVVAHEASHINDAAKEVRTATEQRTLSYGEIAAPALHHNPGAGRRTRENPARRENQRPVPLPPKDLRMTTSPEPSALVSSTPSRRTVLAGAAWTLPAVAAATVAPVASASTTTLTFDRALYIGTAAPTSPARPSRSTRQRPAKS